MAENIAMPKLGFDMREGVLVRWVKNEGEQINKGDVLAEIETDKATVEVESSAAGIVRKLLASPGDVLPVGSTIAIVGTADEKIDAPAAPTASQTSKVESQPAASSAATQTAPMPVPIVSEIVPTETGPVKASPLAKKIASDKNINLGAVKGTGPGGRIVRRDIEAALSGGLTQTVAVPVTAPVATPAAKTPAATPLPSYIPVSHEDQVIQSTKLRQAVARRMTESKTTAPHFYVSHEHKMDALMEMRKQINAYLPDNEKISVNDFIVKAVALTLRQFPNLNARLDGDKVIHFGAVNVGVAVTVEGGLLTVVSKDADQKPLRQISAEVKAMASRAREGKIKPDDVDGSTFSTSNLGMYDVENFIAIINPPEAAILAIGSAREVPVVEGGQIKAGWRMKATISVDHRISDGAEAAQFMLALAKFLEEPLRLLV
jgi:pyruvate dehydrogenase E2 component (dihydrolipoyllysine-residue acetyltransferase)